MNEGYTLFVILETGGKIARKCGAMVTIKDRLVCGTIGGGNVEREAIAKSLEVESYAVCRFYSCSGGWADIGIYKNVDSFIIDKIRNKKEQISLKIEGDYIQVIDSLEGVHGEKVFKSGNAYIHSLRPRKHLIIAGGGHVGQEVKELARYMGYKTTLYDISIHGLNHVDFDDRFIKSYSELLTLVEDDIDTALVILTKGIEKNLIKKLSEKKLFYFGMLGHDDYASFFSPIGLDLGSENVKEVALSAVSEIEAIYHGGKGGHLKYKEGRLVLVRGAGDLATGVIIALKRAGFRVVATEIASPTVIRRTVSFAEAVYENTCTIENIVAEKALTVDDVKAILERGNIPVLIDKDLNVLNEISFEVVVDAIIAKKNLGTNKDMAPFVIALGPGFYAGKDCDVTIETKRGHNLARIIKKGCATPNTGVPGLIEGFGEERVIHTQSSGCFKGCVEIGTIVKKGDLIAKVDDTPIYATLDGMVRGMLRSGLTVPKSFKVADIDPRGENADFKTVSDKARALGNAVLLAIMEHLASC